MFGIGQLSHGTFSAEYLEHISWTKFNHIRQECIRLQRIEQPEIDKINAS